MLLFNLWGKLVVVTLVTKIQMVLFNFSNISMILSCRTNFIKAAPLQFLYI